MKKIRARAPLRLGFAGGGTDLVTYIAKYGGAVVNTTIDKYAYTTVVEQQSHVIFSSVDKECSAQIESLTGQVYEKYLLLHFNIYKFFVEKYNNSQLFPVRIITSCDAPAGSGLGSSSALVVSMVKALACYLEIDMGGEKLAETAYHIEREICGLSGGKQDQYAASFGGMNLFEFQNSKTTKVKNLELSNSFRAELEASILLYFTGVSRESSKIIDAQEKSTLSGSSESLNAMHSMKEQAHSLFNSIINEDFDELVKCISAGWEHKKRSSNSISNNLIDDVIEMAKKQGALAAKVSGAGGGGFIMFICEAEKRLNVAKSLEKFGGIVSTCQLSSDAATTWKV